MVDIAQKIAAILSPLATVELADSEADLRLPSIYITPLSNASEVTFDNRDFLTNVSYQVDVYAETPQKCAKMAQAVDDIMQDNGWTRSNGQPMGRQRYVLTYTALVSEKFNTYKE